jgi:hypothetical protein
MTNMMNVDINDYDARRRVARHAQIIGMTPQDLIPFAQDLLRSDPGISLDAARVAIRAERARYWGNGGPLPVTDDLIVRSLEGLSDGRGPIGGAR